VPVPNGRVVQLVVAILAPQPRKDGPAEQRQLQAGISRDFQDRAFDDRDRCRQNAAEGQLSALLASAGVERVVDGTADQEPPTRLQRPDIIQLEDADPRFGIVAGLEDPPVEVGQGRALRLEAELLDRGGQQFRRTLPFRAIFERDVVAVVAERVGGQLVDRRRRAWGDQQVRVDKLRASAVIRPPDRVIVFLSLSR
jgi:hypothetical protein